MAGRLWANINDLKASRSTETTFCNTEGYIVSLHIMFMDEVRPYKIVLLTRVASRGVTGLYLSLGINIEHARTAQR